MANESPLSYDFIMYIMKMIFLAITVIVVSVITYTFVLQDIKVENLQMQSITEEIYNSNLIMYQDQITKRVEFGVVDLNKFQTVDFSNKLYTQKNNIAFKIDLFNSSNSIVKRYYVSDDEDTQKNYAEIDVLRDYPERLATLQVERPVLIRDGFNFWKGKIIIDVLVQK